MNPPASLADSYFNKPTDKKKEQLIKNVSCQYCGGHPNLQKETTGILYIYDQHMEFHIYKKQFEIAIKDIEGIELLSQEQITQRYTATRLLALGFLALAVPKKQNNSMCMLLIQYKIGEMECKLFLKFEDSFTKTQRDKCIEVQSTLMKLKMRSSWS